MTKMGKTMRALKVGDSFIVKYKPKSLGGPHRMAERVGIKIATRRMDDGYLRIWRIE
jgi:hypothetical protein